MNNKKIDKEKTKSVKNVIIHEVLYKKRRSKRKNLSSFFVYHPNRAFFRTIY